MPTTFFAGATLAQIVAPVLVALAVIATISLLPEPPRAPSVWAMLKRSARSVA